MQCIDGDYGIQNIRNTKQFLIRLYNGTGNLKHCRCCLQQTNITSLTTVLRDHRKINQTSKIAKLFSYSFSVHQKIILFYRKRGQIIMSDIMVHLKKDLQEMQEIMQKYVNSEQTSDGRNLDILSEKSIYLENTYTLEELQAEGLSNAEIINGLEAVGIFLGYSDVIRNQKSEAIDHFMMALHYNPYSSDALCSLLDIFLEDMEEEGRGSKVYEFLSKMYNFDEPRDRDMVMDCALEAGFVQLCSEISIRETEKIKN